MKFKVLVEYEYPIEHKIPVKAELILHGDRVVTDNIKWVEQQPILDKIRAEIEQVKSIMNEEIINHDRKDLINFVNGLNQSLVIINKYKAESEVE